MIFPFRRPAKRPMWSPPSLVPMIAYPCPPRDRWSALLRDELPADEQADLDAHLERCPDCQRILEDCAAHRDVWAGARKLREPSPHDVALRTVMERLKTDPDAE